MTEWSDLSVLQLASVARTAPSPAQYSRHPSHPGHWRAAGHFLPADSVVDFDVANVSDPTDLLSYSWSVSDVGGGSLCQASWLAASPRPTTGDIASDGEPEQLAVALTPVGTGVDRNCRVTLTVSDSLGVRFSAPYRSCLGGGCRSGGRGVRWAPRFDHGPWGLW